MGLAAWMVAGPAGAADTARPFTLYGAEGIATDRPAARAWPLDTWPEAAPLPWNFGGAAAPPRLGPGAYADRIASGEVRWFVLGGAGPRVEIRVAIDAASAFAAVPDPSIEVHPRDVPGAWVEVRDPRRRRGPRRAYAESLWVPWRAPTPAPATLYVEVLVLGGPDRRVLAARDALVAPSEGADLAFGVDTAGATPLYLVVRTTDPASARGLRRTVARPTDGARLRIEYDRP